MNGEDLRKEWDRVRRRGHWSLIVQDVLLTVLACGALAFVIAVALEAGQKL